MEWFARLKDSCRTLLSRLTRQILMKYWRALLSLRRFFLLRRISVDWKLSKEDLIQLRSLTASKGWNVYIRKLKLLSKDGEEWLMNAETERQLHHRKGFLRGILKVLELEENLRLSEELSQEVIEEERLKELAVNIFGKDTPEVRSILAQ